MNSIIIFAGGIIIGTLFGLLIYIVFTGGVD